MIFSQETVDLHDDSFKGSDDELRISQEVFYGNVAGSCDKRCAAVGATNSASEENKMAEILDCINSEDSAVTNQTSSKDLSQKDADTMEFQCDFEARSSMERSVPGARIDNDVHAKRMKLSVNELSNFKPYLDKAVASSIPMKQVVSGMYHPAVHSSSQILMCHVVESSREGVKSSCYLLKQYPESDRKDLEDGRAPNGSLTGSDGSELKQVGGIKSIASPVSQESSATKLLVPSPSAAMVSASGPLQCVKRKNKKDLSLELEDDDVLLTTDSMKDSRTLLRSRVLHLLRSAGWSTKKQKRSNGNYRYIYECPEGKRFREFRIVWNLFGEGLLGHGNYHMAGDDKNWTDVGQFWSDLYDTLRYIENRIDDWEPRYSLTHQWSLLNPFVIVVLVDRKIHALRTGNQVKANQSAIEDGAEGIKHGLEAVKSRSIYVSEGNSLRLVKTISKIENRSLRTCKDENMPACVSDSTCIQHSSCLYGVPLGKADLQNGSIDSQSCRKVGRPKKRAGDKRRSKACRLKDDDLLISAIIKKRSFRTRTNNCGADSGKLKLKPLKKRKTQKGSCRLLLRSFGKGGKNLTERWSVIGERTVLSWLISAGAIFINEMIQYRDPKGDVVVKDGLITRDGILCKCCSEVFSVTGFKIHAGFKHNRPCLNLFMGSGRPYTLCQLQAWSAEYKTRRTSTPSIPVDEFDKNDDSCGLCGDGGELLCCDNCPSTFHQSCLSAEELPEGSWYCVNCTCRLCGDLVNDKETSTSYVGLKCSQCEQKYHQGCMIDKGMDRVGGSPWFCGIGCEEVYGGLQSCVGLSNMIADGYSWTLLRCIHDDQKVPSPQRFALKAECNSKLAVAVTIMEECFLSMIDPRTGIDMIPQVVYNWGSEFARLDYHGFYTVVLEKDDVLISVASIRVHGVAIAEMPLIATCSKYRRQGMCRRLLNSIEKMLRTLKVEKLVVAAIADLVDTWTIGFGFTLMEEDEKRSLSKLNLMVFPGTVMLKKTLYVNEGAQDVSPAERNESFNIEGCLEGATVGESKCDNTEQNGIEGVDGELNVKLISFPDAEGVDAQKCSEAGAGPESEVLNSLGSLECEDKNTNIAGFTRLDELSGHSDMDIGSEKERSETGESTDSKVSSGKTSNAKDYLGLQNSAVGSDINSDDNVNLPVIENQNNCLLVNRPESMEEDDSLNRVTEECSDRLISIPNETHIEAPDFASQVESRIMEAEPHSELRKFVLEPVGEAESISEATNMSGNMTPKLMDSEAVKEGERDAGCMKIEAKPDHHLEPPGSLDSVFSLQKASFDQSFGHDVPIFQVDAESNSGNIMRKLVDSEAVKEDERAARCAETGAKPDDHQPGSLDSVFSLQKRSSDPYFERDVPTSSLKEAESISEANNLSGSVTPKLMVSEVVIKDESADKCPVIGAKPDDHLEPQGSLNSVSSLQKLSPDQYLDQDVPISQVEGESSSGGNDMNGNMTPKLMDSEAMKENERAAECVETGAKPDDHLEPPGSLGSVCSLQKRSFVKDFECDVSIHAIEEAESISEANKSNGIMTPKLIDSVAVKEDESTAGCAEIGANPDDRLEAPESLDSVFSLQKRSSDLCFKHDVPILARGGVSGSETKSVNDNEKQLSLIEQSREASVLPSS